MVYSLGVEEDKVKEGSHEISCIEGLRTRNHIGVLRWVTVDPYILRIIINGNNDAWHVSQVRLLFPYHVKCRIAVWIVTMKPCMHDASDSVTRWVWLGFSMLTSWPQTCVQITTPSKPVHNWVHAIFLGHQSIRNSILIRGFGKRWYFIFLFA